MRWKAFVLTVSVHALSPVLQVNATATAEVTLTVAVVTILAVAVSIPVCYDAQQSQG